MSTFDDLDELADMGISIPHKPTNPPPPPTQSMMQQRLSHHNSRNALMGHNQPTSSLSYEEEDLDDDDDGWHDLQDEEEEDEHWTEEEDQFIISVVQRKGINNVKWRDVAFHLNDRIGEDCKDRWLEVLEPRLKHAKRSRKPKDNDNSILQAAGFDAFDEISSMQHYLKSAPVDKKEIKQQKKAFKARQRESSKGSPRSSPRTHSQGSQGSAGPSSLRLSDVSANSSVGGGRRSESSRKKPPANTTLGPITFCVLSVVVIVGAFCLGLILAYIRFHDKDKNDTCSLPEYGSISQYYCPTSDCTTSWDISAINTQADEYFEGVSSYTGNRRLATRLWGVSDSLLDASMRRFALFIADMYEESDDGGGDEASVTTTELETMALMKLTYKDATVDDYLPNWPAYASNVTQSSRFYVEDTSYEIFKDFLDYFNFGSSTYETLDDANNVCGDIALRLQDQFQRARPFQGARALNMNNSFLLTTSQTPSYPSRHALQGYCMAAAAYEIMEFNNVTGSLTSYGWSSTTGTQALVGLAMAYADRRVMAGVTYPSDVYASAVVVNMLLSNATAWPKAYQAQLRFPVSHSERATMCGDTYPNFCSSITLL